MLTDLVQIRRIGEQKRDENERFRKHLKRHNFVERKFRAIAQDVEAKVDCTVCANCCREATVKLAERDVDRLGRFLRLKRGQFIRDYTDETEEEGLILKRTAEGCIFLDGTQCGVYEARPHNCENFPHLVRGEGSLLSRMWEFKDRACYCPIVFNALEAFKEEVKFK
ncbi:MAG TPA: YkgJ family cysteine cluster protein [Bryobacteraceae bacterium]|nr:YkgJ family cysteine cluster protein [Bryobacteraceae bacterium]